MRYFIYVQFKFELSRKTQRNKLNQLNIAKKVKIPPNFKLGFETVSKSLTRNSDQKTKKK